MAAGALMAVARAHRSTPMIGSLLLGRGDPGEQQAQHQGVVVGAADQVEHGHRVEDHQGEELGPVPVVEAGQPGHAEAR